MHLNPEALRGTKIKELSTELGENSAQAESFLLALIALLRDAPCGAKPTSTINLVFREIEDMGFIPYVLFLSSLSDTILATCEMTGTGNLTGSFVPEMKRTPIFMEYLHWYKSGDPLVLRYCLSFLRMGRKLKWVDPAFQDTAFRKWLEVEDKLASLDLPETDRLRETVAFLLDAKLEKPHTSRHGPGSTADVGRSIVRKCRKAVLSKNLQYIKDHGPLGLDSEYNHWIFGYFRGSTHSIASTSKLLFVPKDLKTSRSICMEPSAYMYSQQWYMSSLTNAISKSRIGKMVQLESQERNQNLAMFGSCTTLVDTIDLSSASDSVALSLVKKIFPPGILFYLLGTRSKFVRLPNGNIIEPKKFAPMGSALCFPVQCIVFSAITMMAYVEWQMARSHCSYTTAMKLVFANLSEGFFTSNRLLTPAIYGDDIICDSRVTDRVIELLKAYGFTVNEGKSFTGGQAVRESCGIYAWNGYDVTPFLYSIDERDDDISHYPSLIALCNRAGSYRFYELRSHLIWRIKAYYRYPLFSSDDRVQCAIKCTNPDNSHLEKRQNTNWQRIEIRSLSVASRRTNRRIPDWYRLLQWWSSASLLEREAPIGRFEVHSVLSWRWTPEE